MHEAGYKVFLEVGPRGLMTSAIEETLKGKSFAAIATNSIHRRGILQALHAIAQLAALGAPISVSSVFARRQAKKLDFDAAISMEVRRFSEMRLSRLFPKMTLTGGERKVMEADFTPGVQARGAKAAMRAAALAERNRRVRQFDFGVVYPMLSDADEISSSPGISCELSKTFTLEETPFIGDFSYGSSQLSYSDPNLRGLVMLAIPVAVEIMAEAAIRVMPKRHLAAIEDFVCRRQVKFEKGRLALTVHAERTAAADPRGIAVKVQLRNDMPNAEYTWPIMEATFILAEEPPHSSPQQVDSLSRPRSVHWSGRDIYPSKLGFGPRLRGIVFAELWGEGGLDYEVAVPKNANCVSHTHFPIWAVNPLLMQVIVSGFTLWRRHERFTGAFSYPCRFRRMELRAALPTENSKLNCYLRLTGVTPRSHLCDITVTSGDGNEVIKISGWEEITDRVPQRYCEMILQPATSFITESLSSEALGDPATDVSSAFVTDVPYPLFEKDEEFWLKIMSHVVLNHPERKEFSEMSGSTRRRTEWLFGRIAAKEAVRRYLKDFYQARWSDADVQIWADDSGKPHALGAWSDFLTTKLDIAIAHTAQFVVAVAAANARVGVDVESSNRDLSEEFTAGVFTHDELELAAQAANPSQTIIRFWCAKEAVSKALGTGIRYSPREMVVADYLPDSGVLTMRLEGAWAEAFKRLKGRSITVSVGAMREHALAFCFIPASLFETA
jgi:phosphopantetheine--protein transferase-like protein